MSQDFETPEPSQPAPARKTGPKLKLPVPPDLPDHDPEAGSPHRKLSTMVGINFLMLLLTASMLGFLILLQYKPPVAEPAPAVTADASKPAPADEVKPEVDRLKAEIAALTKKLEDRPAVPDPSAQLKALDDKIADLGKTVGDMPARLDSLNSKLEVVSKGEGLAPAPKVEAIDKKVAEMAQTLEAMKADLAAKPASTTITPAPVATAAAAAEADPAMDQAVALFKQGKFAEARDAFTRLQAAAPDDARVWYFSALANGLATRNWKGESEKLVAAGVAKEKAGSPDKAKIDAAFADLTTLTGKDWLAYYRKSAAQ